MAICLNCNNQSETTSCRCCCPGSSPEFPNSVNVNTYITEVNMASKPGQWREENLTVDTSGPTPVATLEYLPLTTDLIWLYRNGQLITAEECWTRSGKVILFEDGVIYDEHSFIVAKYFTLDEIPEVPLADVGTLQTQSGSLVPDGWLLADGSVISQASFPLLFAVIGHDYAKAADDTDAFDAAGTFRLPDLENTMSDGTTLVKKRMIIKY